MNSEKYHKEPFHTGTEKGTSGFDNYEIQNMGKLKKIFGDCEQVES